MMEKHQEKLDTIEQEFSSTEEFLAWKADIEKEITSWYVKKKQGTSKIGGNCTAHMKVTTCKTS